MDVRGVVIAAAFGHGNQRGAFYLGEAPLAGRCRAAGDRRRQSANRRPKGHPETVPPQNCAYSSVMFIRARSYDGSHALTSD